MIISQINGVYDPIGLHAPFTVRTKILMKKLLQDTQQISSDNSVYMKQKEKWIEFFVEMFQMQKTTFQRCLKSKNAIGNLSLVAFSDASEEAFGSCAYLRCELENRTFSNKLIMLKNQVTPIRKMTLLSSEFYGAVLSARINQYNQ